MSRNNKNTEKIELSQAKQLECKKEQRSAGLTVVSTMRLRVAYGRTGHQLPDWIAINKDNFKEAHAPQNPQFKK